LDSFHKHVYEVVIEGKNEDTKNEGVMTKLEARTVLQLEGDAIDKSEIKRAYRNLSFALHPDRFVGTDKTVEEVKVSSDEFARVKLAYETMQSGTRNEGRSWYESLGGKSRTDFAGPINLLPLAMAESTLKSKKAQSAITSLSKDIVQTFVVRSQASV
jgi:curved DNA-binding protein CbpA